MDGLCTGTILRAVQRDGHCGEEGKTSAAQWGEPRWGLAVLSFSNMDMVSPHHGVFRPTTADADLLRDATLRCCGLRRDMRIVADTSFYGQERAFWVLPHWGPCWT